MFWWAWQCFLERSSIKTESCNRYRGDRALHVRKRRCQAGDGCLDDLGVRVIGRGGAAQASLGLAGGDAGVFEHRAAAGIGHGAPNGSGDLLGQEVGCLPDGAQAHQ